jgi:glycine/D-amino acid oxidase-like deaminating enzyme
LKSFRLIYRHLLVYKAHGRYPGKYLKKDLKHVSMSMKKSTDVVVIGGGAVGSAVAYYLACKQLQVTLVEKKGIAAGTSGRCEGDVLVCDKRPGFDLQLATLSQNLFAELTAELDYDFGWTRKGSLLAIENEEEMQAAEILCAQLSAEGVPMRILDQSEVHADEAHLAPDIIGGLETDCDGSLNPMALAGGLTYGAQKLGAEVMTHTVVTGIQLNGRGQIAGVETNRGRLSTRNIVNAAGVWAPQIGAMVGLNIPIKPRQGQLIVAERSLPVARRKVMEFGYMMAKFGSGDYVRNVTPDMEKYGVALVYEPTEAKNFLIGSSRRFVGFDTTVNLNVIRAIAQRAKRFFPVIKDIRMIRSYAGLRPYTPDHFPIISATAVPGFYIAAGHEGDGIGLSLITGKLITQMICHETPAISLEPLKFSRFESRDSTRSEDAHFHENAGSGKER